MVLLIKTRLYNLTISKLRINAYLVFFNRHLRLITSYYYIYYIYTWISTCEIFKLSGIACYWNWFFQCLSATTSGVAVHIFLVN